MTVYTRALKGMIGDVTVEAVENGRNVPVLHMGVSDAGFPLDVNKAAANLIDVLNGRAPEHRLNAGDNRIFYNRAGNTLVLRWQSQQSGLTMPGMVITGNEKGTASDLSRAALDRLTQEAMKQFCDAVVTGPELSGNDGGGSRNVKKQPKPQSF